MEKFRRAAIEQKTNQEDNGFHKAQSPEIETTLTGN